MRTVGIIAEYNPFHQGHSYHIKKVKEITNSDYVVVIMSGNFTQRGTPAIINKYERTNMALNNGADLVIELPAVYACASAEFFALGSMSLLNNLGIIDCICFGSECGDIEILQKIAGQLVHPSDAFEKSMKSALKSGCSYPTARANSLMAIDPDFCRYADVLATPNNILGIEYLKALSRLNSTIEPFTMKRIGSDYHDKRMGTHQCSALAIRHALKEQTTLSKIKNQVPENVYTILEAQYEKTFPIFTDDFSKQLQYKLLTTQSEGFSQYLDVSPSLSDKILKNLPKYTGYEDFCDLLKSKDMTHARISRCLAHILLDMKEETVQNYIKNGVTFYARMLGFRKKASPLMSALKENSSIPLISKLADASDNLDEIGQQMLNQDILCAHIYDALVADKFSSPMGNEYTRKIITLT